MSLTLEMPDLSEDQRSPTLRLADIEEMQTRRRRYIDGLVAEQWERYQGLPDATLRHILTRGQNDFVAAERLLKEPQ